MPAELDQALKINPVDEDALHWLLHYHHYNGDYPTAQDIADRVLSRLPLFFPSRMILGDMLRQQGDGVLIDTPGMRELQLWDAEGGLEQTFADVQSLATACRFRDCSHRAEPGCAVVAAVERGELQAERLDSYHRLRREDAFLQSRHDERAQSGRTRTAKQGSKAAKLFYKLRRR